VASLLGPNLTDESEGGESEEMFAIYFCVFATPNLTDESEGAESEEMFHFQVQQFQTLLTHQLNVWQFKGTVTPDLLKSISACMNEKVWTDIGTSTGF